MIGIAKVIETLDRGKILLQDAKVIFSFIVYYEAIKAISLPPDVD